MNRKYRSGLAQVRCGILPLEVKCGHWKGLKLDERKCKLCIQSAVEDESHFLFECPKYNTEGDLFMGKYTDAIY